MTNESMNEWLNDVLRNLDKLPEPARTLLRREIIRMKELLVDNRPARIITIGRRGSGKSSLINAIFGKEVAPVGPVVSETGEPLWHSYEAAQGSMRILDTRGMGDLTTPVSSTPKDAISAIQQEIEKERPDAALFLCKAKEVDARITEDLEGLARIRNLFKTLYEYELPVIAVATQVDELDPVWVNTPPYEHAVKKANIAKAEAALQGALEGAGVRVAKTIAVSACADFTTEPVFTRYYNVDSLIDYLLEVLPNDAQLQLARLSAFKSVQRRAARRLINCIAVACGGIGATPIPIADLIPITSLQIGMITCIAFLSGRQLSKKSAFEFLVAMGANIGAGFVFRELARAAAKLIVGYGNATSGLIAASATRALGEAAIAYFLDDATPEEAKQAYEKARQEHQAEGELVTG